MLTALLDLVLPAECAGCSAPGAVWCDACAAAVAPSAAWTEPDPPPPGFPPTARAGAYAGPLRAALVAHKEEDCRAVRPVLAEVLAAALRLAAVGRPLVVVPVPSSRSAVRTRGGDPVLAMTRAATRLAGGELVPALVHVRRAADQAGLATTERAANLSGALTVLPWRATGLLRAAQAGAQVVVADDVCTTGATLAEAARALRVAGLVGVRGAVAAATVLRRSTGTGISADSRPAAGVTEHPGGDPSRTRKRASLDGLGGHPV